MLYIIHVVTIQTKKNIYGLTLLDETQITESNMVGNI